MNRKLSTLAENIGAVSCQKIRDCNHSYKIDKKRCMGHPEKYKKCLAYFEKKGYNREQALLLFRKGVLPYDYIVSCDKFSETSLPSIEKFTSVLNGKISQDDYIHAQNVWNAFDCKNLGEYQDIYLTTDVLLLSDVWETFRKMSMKYYELDPSHYISAHHYHGTQ